MRKVYISGAITGVDNWQMQFQAGERAVLNMFGDENDLVIQNPLRFPKPNVEPGDPQKEWQAYMKLSFERLLTCDTIYMLKGWEKSRGAFNEFFMAKELGMNIIYE